MQLLLGYIRGFVTIPQHQFSSMDQLVLQIQGLLLEKLRVLYETVRMQEVSECLHLKLNIMDLWSVTAQSYKSSKRTGLETRFKFEWRQQPWEEGMLFYFDSYRCDNSCSSCRPTLTFTSLSPQCFVGGVKRAAPGAVQGPAPGPLPNKNLYEHHYAALEQLAKPQTKPVSSEGSAGPGSPIRYGFGVLVPC